MIMFFPQTLFYALCDMLWTESSVLRDHSLDAIAGSQ